MFIAHNDTIIGVFFTLRDLDLVYDFIKTMDKNEDFIKVSKYAWFSDKIAVLVLFNEDDSITIMKFFRRKDKKRKLEEIFEKLKNKKL